MPHCGLFYQKNNINKMYKKEIERKFLVDRTLIPDITKYPSVKIQQGYLSSNYDLLEVRVRSEEIDSNMEYYLILKDSGTKIRNEICYKITKEEFEISIQLCGNKVIKKTRYKIPYSKDNSKILELDIYQDIDLIVCEYEGESEIDVDSLIPEDWFIKDITEDTKYKNFNIAMNLNNFK